VENLLYHPNLKLKGISTDSQVSSAFYTTKQTPPLTQVDDEGGSLSPSASDFNAPLPTPHQCVVIHAPSKIFFLQIDWPALQNDFSSKKNQALMCAYHAKFSESERSLIKTQWTEKMIELQKHILFFNFLQKYCSPTNALNVVKKYFVKKDKTVVKSSHPPLENLLIDYKGITVKASPFKSTDFAHPKNRKIIKQNNFVNQSLHTIGQQLDHIEEKIPTPVIKIEKPLLSLPEGRKSLGLKTTSEKNAEKK
jgi:hypothetical protein